MISDFFLIFSKKKENAYFLRKRRVVHADSNVTYFDQGLVVQSPIKLILD